MFKKSLKALVSGIAALSIGCSGGVSHAEPEIATEKTFMQKVGNHSVASVLALLCGPFAVVDGCRSIKKYITASKLDGNEKTWEDVQKKLSGNMSSEAFEKLERDMKEDGLKPGDMKNVLKGAGTLFGMSCAVGSVITLLAANAVLNGD